MFFTMAGTPAGYGYYGIQSVANENIVPAMVTYLKENSVDKNNFPITFGSISIQVQTQAKVSINERAPILVEPNIGLSFDARGIYSIAFTTSAVMYNICVSY